MDDSSSGESAGIDEVSSVGEDFAGPDFGSFEKEAPLVSAEFTDAYSFRCLVEYLSLTNDNGNFIFTNEGISFSRENDSRQILNEVRIYAWELTTYNYWSERDEIIAGLSLADFRGVTKSIGKKDVACLDVYESGVHLRVFTSAKKSSGEDVDIIRTQRIEHENYHMEGYQSDSEPNLTASMSQFASACGVPATCKDGIVIMTGFDRGMCLKATQGGNLRASIKRLGRVSEADMHTIGSSEPNPNKVVEHKLRRKFIIALSKLNNISPNGTVKIYLQKDLPVKLNFHVSSYGTLNVYLRGE